jgi:hypothetical protein
VIEALGELLAPLTIALGVFLVARAALQMT